ncbi:MAG: hypothetical protein ABSF67_03805 [Roseiarcus sp.]|jgi:hypothetical protein
MSPLRRIELTLTATCGVAALFHTVDAAFAAVVGLVALKLMRTM